MTELDAIRVKQLLELMCSGVQVVVNHDHEKTQVLVNLAKSADIFVVGWRSSKHQAYYCAKKHVKEKNLILQIVKGSTGIFNSMKDYIYNV